MRTPELALAFTLAALVAVPAAAQYKWIAPNGAVTYSDQPPPPGMSGGAIGAAGSAVARADDGGVPPALRDAASKYPVTLYTTAECPPCRDARAHLTKRGVPFAEKTVATTQDAEQFRKVGFTENSFPAVTVGRERSQGFEAGAWNQLLDAAGYPKTSVMPANWKAPAPQPMAGAPKPVEAGVAVAEAKPRKRQRAEPDPMLPAASRDPNAIRF